MLLVILAAADINDVSVPWWLWTTAAIITAVRSINSGARTWG